MHDFDVAVVGAGVLGAFHAFFACRRGLRTLLAERTDGPRAASARNFGMIVPSGTAPGDWHRRALESAAVYREVLPRLGVTFNDHGTQYLATTAGERHVLEEFAELGPARGYRCTLLDADASARLNPAVDPATCLGSLHFPDDLRFEPRAFFRAFLPWLQKEWGCTYLPGTVVDRAVFEGGVGGAGCALTTASGDEYRARHVFLCTGSETRALLPRAFAGTGLVHCKLQMMRLAAPGDVRLTTALASGLTLRRYPSFGLCPSRDRLREEAMDPEFERRGIHVLIAQDDDGRLVVGDSHEYAPGDFDDTLDARTEELILAEARRLVRLPRWEVVERWHGVYSQHPGRDLCAETVLDRLHLVTGIGGKGMTTGPALAREAVERLT